MESAAGSAAVRRMPPRKAKSKSLTKSLEASRAKSPPKNAEVGRTAKPAARKKPGSKPGSKRAASQTSSRPRKKAKREEPEEPKEQEQQEKSEEQEKPEKPEKRLARQRSRAPEDVAQRICRAVGQRMYLVHRGPVIRSDSDEGASDLPRCELAILGSTGNLYRVTLSRVSTCDCPDAFRRGKRHSSALCKHILFALLKVAGLPRHDAKLYQAALLESELDRIFHAMDSRASAPAVLANAAVRTAFAAASGLQQPPLDDPSSDSHQPAVDLRKSPAQQTECLICFDALPTKTIHDQQQWDEQVIYCQMACGSNFHSSCIQKWISSSKRLRSNYGKSENDAATCPACRSTWIASPVANPYHQKSKKRNPYQGYENFGAEAGLPSRRDTSTYYTWSRYEYDD